MIYIGTIDELWNVEEDSCECWAIVHSCEPDQIPSYAVQVPDLAPNDVLFKTYRDIVHANQFSKEWFENVYTPCFLKGIVQNAKSQELLKYLCEKSKTHDFYLACFCKIPNLCHRMIVANLLYCMGADIEVHNDHCHRQYKMYLQFLETNK